MPNVAKTAKINKINGKKNSIGLISLRNNLVPRKIVSHKKIGIKV